MEVYCIWSENYVDGWESIWNDEVYIEKSEAEKALRQLESNSKLKDKHIIRHVKTLSINEESYTKFAETYFDQLPT